MTEKRSDEYTYIFRPVRKVIDFLLPCLGCVLVVGEDSVEVGLEEVLAELILALIIIALAVVF